MTTTTEHELTYQLNASAIEEKSGVIRGATVAQAGVEATGKYLLLDASGKATYDPELAVRKLKVYTDDATLDSLMAAAQAAGGVLKVRSDHDNALESRAGYADNFQRVDNRVVCDLHLNESYRDRDIVLETARVTPKLIGLSIDMVPTFVVTKDAALMRIGELLAVDIVDEGAITHDGLFLSRGVDSKSVVVTKNEISPKTNMADQKEPTLADCMSALAALSAVVAKLSAPAAEKGSDELAAFRTELAAIKENQVKLSQERSALGLKPEEAASLKLFAEQESERARLAAEAAKFQAPKSYLEQVEAKKAEGKLKASECHRFVMNADPKAYAAHLLSLNVIKK